MDMTKKFVYAKGAGIVFCPDDVLYVKENYEMKWNNDKGDFLCGHLCTLQMEKQ